MKKLHIYTLALLALAGGCKKDNPEPDPVTKAPAVDKEMNLITASPWIIYKVELNNINVWDILIEPCQKDDTYRFFKDSTLMTYENSQICSGNEDSTQSNWTFYNGRSKLIGTVLGLTDTADILTLTETDLKLNINYEGNPAMIYFRKP